ncbi:Hypothetical protein HEAR2979 [Herminiimonas arsenicoxydans]|uniref:Uncharacterized protein n=1 Tax=Herminiimonas arsenicoxydans TaxID=204773 RepID=A4G9A2_HERAR|nr:Hypothetical protein HEAR2979 [Herminiimonas arsenicoxydans]
MVISEEVLARAYTVPVQLKSSGTTAAYLVNISARQRMLLQRMARFYQVINRGMAAPDALINLARAREECLRAVRCGVPASVPARIRCNWHCVRS